MSLLLAVLLILLVLALVGRLAVWTTAGLLGFGPIGLILLIILILALTGNL